MNLNPGEETTLAKALIQCPSIAPDNEALQAVILCMRLSTDGTLYLTCGSYVEWVGEEDGLTSIYIFPSDGERIALELAGIPHQKPPDNLTELSE